MAEKSSTSTSTSTPTRHLKKKHRLPKTPDLSDVSKVTKNERGGVNITEEEIETAFRFFDVDRTGQITFENLRDRLAAAFVFVFNDKDKHKNNMSVQEIRSVWNGKDGYGLSLEAVKELLMENEEKAFDPIAQAFCAFDPKGTGFVEADNMEQVFKTFGFGLTEEEIKYVVKSADQDKDGRISLDDFRNMLTN